MKRAIVAVSVCLGASPAFATDWALNSTLSQTVELNDNPFLQALAGGAFRSYSTIAANAVAKTPTSKFTFDGDASYQKYWGPGVDGQQSESIAGGARLHYETLGKVTNDRDYVDASWHRQSTAFALLGDLGFVTNTRGFIDTSTIGGGIDRQITNRDFVNLAARTTYTSYDPGGGGTPFYDSSASGTWKHRVSPIATLTSSSEVEMLNFDNALGTRITILRENAGLETTLSPVLSFNGFAGLGYVITEHGVPAFSLTPAPGTNASANSTALDFVTNMALTYKMFPDTTLTLTGVQSISPSVVGSLTKLTSLSAGLAYQVNSRETLSFSGSASRQSSSGTTTDFLSASVVYGYLLTREWTAQLSYRYLHRLASTSSTPGAVIDPVTGVVVPAASGLGAVSSNSVMLVVSRSVTVLPDGY